MSPKQTGVIPLHGRHDVTSYRRHGIRSPLASCRSYRRTSLCHTGVMTSRLTGDMASENHWRHAAYIDGVTLPHWRHDVTSYRRHGIRSPLASCRLYRWPSLRHTGVMTSRLTADVASGHQWHHAAYTDGRHSATLASCGLCHRSCHAGVSNRISICSAVEHYRKRCRSI